LTVDGGFEKIGLLRKKKEKRIGEQEKNLNFAIIEL
jgi:hypothetical protein